MNGKLTDLSYSRTGANVLTITTRESCKSLWERLGDQEITFDIKKKVEPRSLRANNYAWALIDQLAVVLRTDKNDLYEKLLQQYGASETYLDDAGHESVVMFSLKEGIPPRRVTRHYSEVGDGFVNGQRFIHYRAIKGTSEYSSKEMSVFLDGVIYECQLVGIETATPEELSRYMEDWGHG